MSQLQDAIQRGTLRRARILEEQERKRVEKLDVFSRTVEEELQILHQGHDLYLRVENAVAEGLSAFDWHPWDRNPSGSEDRARARAEAMKQYNPKITAIPKSCTWRDQGDSLVEEWYLEISWS